jgi:quercetin dioxygenase-like cupin family protein
LIFEGENAVIRKLAMALILGTALTGAAPPPAPLPAPLPITTFDVPQDKGAQQVQVMKREFPVGSSSGWHVHPGVETAYLLSGVMSLEMAGQPRMVLHPGDSFTVPRGVAHNGANIGKVPARLLIAYVVDKGAPVRTAVPPPAP